MDRSPDFGLEFRTQLERLFAWRRDVRRFRTDPLPAGALDRLLSLATLAPSVGLSEPWRFVLVDDPERRRRVRANFARCNAEALASQASERQGLYARLKLAGLDDAPCQLAVMVDRQTGQGHGLGRLTMPEMIDYSAVIAVHTVWLALRAEGIGLGWVSILDPGEIGAILDVPPGWTLIGYFCIGYPAEETETPALQMAGWERRASAGSVVLRR